MSLRRQAKRPIQRSFTHPNPPGTQTSRHLAILIAAAPQWIPTDCYDQRGRPLLPRRLPQPATLHVFSDPRRPPA